MRNRHNIEKGGFQYYFGYRSLTFMNEHKNPLAGFLGKRASDAFIKLMGLDKINYN